MAPESGRAAAVDLEEMRCRKCKRLLLKVSGGALKPDGRIETKCGSCNAMNYLIGPADDDLTST